MTPDYQLLGTLIALCLAVYWLSEKAAQWRDERNERILARKCYEIQRSHRGWE